MICMCIRAAALETTRFVGLGDVLLSKFTKFTVAKYETRAKQLF